MIITPCILNIIGMKPPQRSVGALTSKLYAFKARPWEIKVSKSIDMCNNLGSPMSISTKDGNILRVTPRYNKDLELEWGNDLSRCIHEANDFHRVMQVYAKDKNGAFQKLRPLYSQKLLNHSSLMAPKALDVVFGVHLDLKSMYDLKVHGRHLGADCLCEFVNNLSKTFALTYSTTKKLKYLSSARSIFLIGVNLRWEATNLNLFLRFRYLRGNFKLISLGNTANPINKLKNYGSIGHTILKLGWGKNLENQSLKPNAFFCIGDSLSQRLDAISIALHCGISHKNQQDGLITLSTGVNSVGASHLGFCNWSNYNDTYLVGPNKPKSFTLLGKKTTICESTHIHDAIKSASIIYPIKTYLEKNAHYMSYNGSVKKAYKVLNFDVGQHTNLTKMYDKAKTRSKYFFNFIKEANKKKYGMSIHTTGVFLSCVQEKKHLKLRLTCIKCIYSNVYTSSSFLTSPPRLLNLSKSVPNLDWAFV